MKQGMPSHSIIPTLLVLSLILLSGSVPAQVAMPDTRYVDEALSQVGMTTNDVAFDQDEMATWGGDPWRLSLYDLFHRHPFKLPLHGYLIKESLTKAVDDPVALLARADRFVDQPIRRGLIGDALEKYTNTPDSLPKPSITRNKNFLSGPEFNPLKDAIDLIYQLTDDKESNFKRGIDEVDKNKLREHLFDYFLSDDEENSDDQIVNEVMQQIDMGRMLAGSQDLAEAVKRLAALPDTIAFPEKKREMKTRRGLIVVGTRGNDRYEYLNPPLLIVDGGGDDEYIFGGYPENYPFSAIVDFGGNDKYISSDSGKPGIGGAIIGCSVVIDRGGDDEYRGANLCQGAALFGSSVMIDEGGNDVYSAANLAQGAAAFGVGVLADVAGDDSLYCIMESQGFGYTLGCGLLVNGEGNDKYVAEDETLIDPSSQTKDHNNSLAQGAGFGKRADYLDGHSWAGGVGILCDAAGDDTYSAGLFAQGVGYWYAVGMLLDGAGNDAYNGVWYVQGSAAHFAVGYLDDFSGDDQYNATHNMADGAGHDFSLGFLMERGGNDVYHSPNLSLGGGNADGIGILWELGGDDEYHIDGHTTLGMANEEKAGIRRYLRSIGLFVDEGGHDTYSKEHSDGTKWINQPEDSLSGSIGVGIDVAEDSGVSGEQAPEAARPAGEDTSSR